MRKTRWNLGVISGALLFFVAVPLPARPARPTLAARTGTSIVIAQDASPQEALAGREVRRYVYLRTGVLLPLSTDAVSPAAIQIVIGRKDRTLVGSSPEVLAETARLAPQQYMLKTVSTGGNRALWIVGGDETGVLYGAYRFAEKLGVRFYLHGDVIPDQQIAWSVPVLNETGKPLFSIRGIQPFHDFPEGPDWWNRDDYLAYVTQLPKLRMNFLGLHCYPEGNPHAEPTVWIGLPQDQDERGHVERSYPSFWASTRRAGAWGYAPMPTGDFTGGAAQVFPGDDYGHEIQVGLMPEPTATGQSDELFNRAGAMFREVFTLAQRIGVKTALGTETPLMIPRLVQDRLRQLGKDPGDPKVVRELYEGIFRRIKNTHPLDYYWLWTPESWTWEDNKPEQFAETARDLQAAAEALKSLGDPFTLATSGWVLGPAHDRTALDKILPKISPMSCINREVGHDLVEAGFARLRDRPKWAIPWMENDPNLTSPQLWAGRMRYDAVDALKLGCTGLIGIHWRTKILAPNVAALAAAAWDQSYAPGNWDVRGSSRGLGPRGGKGVFSGHPVADTTESIIYQWAREGLDGYDLDMPDGSYRVTLKFNEPVYAEAGKRVFGVKIQGQTVLEHLDIFARAGQHRALDLSFDGQQVSDGHMRIDFTRIAGEPCVSAVVIEGKTAAGRVLTRKVNCGFDAMAGYERDGSNDKPGTVERSRTMPIQEFYVDFARANFGNEVAEEAGQLFARIDGMNLPQTAHWDKGPGGINPIKPAAGEFWFVNELTALRSRVEGKGNLQRFDYWLNTFRFMQHMAEVGGMRAELDSAMATALSESDAMRKRALAGNALRLRIQIARAWERMMSDLVAATDTPGELGTIANLEQHNRKTLNFLDLYDAELSSLLGGPLPPEVQPGRTYLGPARLIVPTVRTVALMGESLVVRVIAVSRNPVRNVELHWRPLGRGAYQTVAARREGRSVYSAILPAGVEDSEYYFSAETEGHGGLIWPATAPRMCQSVVRFAQ